jgi:hypothetical protein
LTFVENKTLEEILVKKNRSPSMQNCPKNYIICEINEKGYDMEPLLRKTILVNAMSVIVSYLYMITNLHKLLEEYMEVLNIYFED